MLHVIVVTNVTVCLSIIANEAALKDLCWIPFGFKSQLIDAKGGSLYLQSRSEELGGTKESTICIEIPPSAVNTSDNVEVHYAIIPHGSFTLPEGYQFGSMVVYIYYDGRHVIKPLRLHLPHWYGGKDPVRDGLSLALAPHSLKKGKRAYHFELLHEGEFPHGSCIGVVEVSGHCSLFAVVFKLGATANYQAICLEKEKGDETVCDIAVTYASYDWRQVRFTGMWCICMYSLACTCIDCCEFVFNVQILISSRGRGWKVGKSTLFQFKLDRIIAKLQEKCHSVGFSGSSEVHSSFSNFLRMA